MQTREPGRIEFELTRVGLGTWAVGGWCCHYAWGPRDAEAIARIVAALDGGINQTGTAAVYGLGNSEELVGKALRKTVHKPVVAAKRGRRGDARGQSAHCLTPGNFRRECEANLSADDTEQTDRLLIHRQCGLSRS
jgi:aryl-alcohol dehydrogenase-like predicted oxidoreductase